MDNSNNMESIAKGEFYSPINIDNGFTYNNISKQAKSEVELFKVSLGNYLVEWFVEELDLVEHVGIFCCETDKVVSDYDGLFEVPEQIIEFLEKEGFDCTYLRE